MFEDILGLFYLFGIFIKDILLYPFRPNCRLCGEKLIMSKYQIHQKGRLIFPVCADCTRGWDNAREVVGKSVVIKPDKSSYSSLEQFEKDFDQWYKQRGVVEVECT